MRAIIILLRRYNLLILSVIIDIILLYGIFTGSVGQALVSKNQLILLSLALLLTILLFFESRNYNKVVRITERMLSKTPLPKEKRKIESCGSLIRNLNRIYLQMESLESQKDNFISDVSHELRTPVSTMKILAESMHCSNSKDITRYKEFFSDIINELDRMNALISDLLESVNLDPSEYIVIRKPIYLNYLCEIAIKNMRPMASAKGIEIKFIEDADIQAPLDGLKIERVIRNLIENSIKYSESGSTIYVRIFLSFDYAGISVRDQGCGIPPADIDKIFERFYRVNKDRSRVSGGCGLGLYMVKHIIDMHDGTIEVQSNENKGSLFTIKLPLK